jgi:hypothetical protein
MKMFKDLVQGIPYSCILVSVALCAGCNAQDRLTANIEEVWPVANVVDLVVNIDRYTKFRDFAKAVPYLCIGDSDEHVDALSPLAGQHRYTAVDVRSDVDRLWFIVWANFDDEKLCSGVLIHGRGPMDSLEIFIRAILTKLHREHQYVFWHVFGAKHRQDTLLCPVLIFESDSRVYILCLTPTLEWSGGASSPPGLTMRIEESDKFDIDNFPLVETSADEKKQIFDESGLSRILDELNIDLHSEPVAQETGTEALGGTISPQ